MPGSCFMQTGLQDVGWAQPSSPCPLFSFVAQSTRVYWFATRQSNSARGGERHQQRQHKNKRKKHKTAGKAEKRKARATLEDAASVQVHMRCDAAVVMVAVVVDKRQPASEGLVGGGAFVRFTLRAVVVAVEARRRHPVVEAAAPRGRTADSCRTRSRSGPHTRRTADAADSRGARTGPGSRTLRGAGGGGAGGDVQRVGAGTRPGAGRSAGEAGGGGGGDEVVGAGGGQSAAVGDTLLHPIGLHTNNTSRAERGGRGE